MNPFEQQQLSWEYGYTLGPSSEATKGAYSAYYNCGGTYGKLQKSTTNPVSPVFSTSMSYIDRFATCTPAYPHNPMRPGAGASHQTWGSTDMSITSLRGSSLQETPSNQASSSWKQVHFYQQHQQKHHNQQQQEPVAKTSYPIKTFVKSVQTPSDGEGADHVSNDDGGGESGCSSSSALQDNVSVCAKLHELAVHNQLVEVYDKIQGELTSGVMAVRLTLGKETFTGTGANLREAKKNAAATALAQSKYPKPAERRTMRPRPPGITATQELHELATRKGVQVSFKFLEPPNFEFRSAMKQWSKDEMRGRYKVQLNVDHFEYFGEADLPQQAKHDASIQALPYLNQIPDAWKAGGDATSGAVVGSDTVVGEGGVYKNVIMVLNEIAMSRQVCVEWYMLKEEGQPHARTYTWSLKFGDFETVGFGSSKKLAKTHAAQQMYAQIPDEWKASNAKKTKKKKAATKRNSFDSNAREGSSGTLSPTKKHKKEGKLNSDATIQDDTARPPIHSVIQAVNPISALYEYTKKAEIPDPEFECVSERVLEAVQKGKHMYKKMEYTMRLEIKGKQFMFTASTKKAAKTGVATDAWNEIKAGSL